MPVSHVQPNILLVMPDQMRGDALSLEGHPALMAPNIDAIGAQGMQFTRAYTTCASCIAARRSLLTGLFPASHGMVGYQEGVALTSRTFPEALRDAGYATALVGRHMHQWPYEHDCGYEHQVLGSTYIANDAYAEALERALPGAGGIRGLGVSFNGWAARPWPYREDLHPTHWTAVRAREVVAQHAADRPLFLTTSFYAPHPPLIPPPFYFERYMRLDLPEPATGSWATPPPDDGLHAGVDVHRCVLRGERLRCAQAGYYGLINDIDDQLYWLIAEFREMSGRQRRPWVIVFTSDHGEMLGDHYLFRKAEPYEGSSRIPLLIQAASELGLAADSACAAPVCLEDIGPTLLDVAGAPALDGVDGRSLVPLLRGEDAPVRSWLHGEHAPAYDAEQGYHMLTDGRSKYIWRPASGREQLFDLEADPLELRDLANDQAHAAALAEWRRRLTDRLRDRPEGFSDGTNLVPGRPYAQTVPAS
jgi:arylsulfatase A-like enzyme